MSKNGKIGVGILGTGNWTQYGHIPVLKTLEDTFERAAIDTTSFPSRSPRPTRRRRSRPRTPSAASARRPER